jgi:shikimate kinase
MDFSLVVLLGMKHTGKSTLSRKLAEERNLRFEDLDRRLEDLRARQHPDEPQLDAREIHRLEGAEGFRKWELSALSEILSESDGWTTGCVLATGGGIADNEVALELITYRPNTLRVLLEEDRDILYDRIVSRGMPSFLDPERPKESFAELFERRVGRFRQIASITVSLRGLHREQAFDKLSSTLEEYSLGR